MWWMIPIAIGSYVVKKTVDKRKQKSMYSKATVISPIEYPKISVNEPKTIFELNLSRLKGELEASKKRRIAIIGQPGAGKSSLLNLLTDGGCIPRPSIGPQTDQTNWNINTEITLTHTHDDYLFVDAPGYNTAEHRTDTFLLKFPFKSFDRIIMVISGKIHEADQKVWKRIHMCNPKKDILIVRSFSEGLELLEQNEILDDLRSKFDANIALVSNRTKTGLNVVKEHIS